MSLWSSKRASVFILSGMVLAVAITAGAGLVMASNDEGTLATASVDSSRTAAGSPAPASVQAATISAGSGRFDTGGFAIVGQALSGKCSGGAFEMSVGAVGVGYASQKRR